MSTVLSPGMDAFSPSRLAFPDACAAAVDDAILEAGSSNQLLSSSHRGRAGLVGVGGGNESGGACMPLSASWLESAERESSSVKTQLPVIASHPYSLSPLNEPNPNSSLSPTGTSFGPTSQPTPNAVLSSLSPLPTLEPVELDSQATHSANTLASYPVEGFPAYLRDALSPQLARPSQDRWDQNAFSLSVAFTGAIYRSHLEGDLETDGTAPPAFFPLQRVGFSPQLKVHSAAGGLPLSLVGGMTLGVTGVVSVPHLDRFTGRQLRDSRTGSRKWRSQRVVVDFVTDLSHGLETWKADAEYATTAAGGHMAMLDGQGILPPGTYILPLSMKIPASEKL